MIKGVLFDLDGTLIDSMSVWGTVGIRLLESYKIKAPTNFNEIVKTMTVSQAAEYLKQHFLPKQTVKEIHLAILQQVMEQYLYQVPARPGVEALLELLYQRNIKMCVVTANEKPLAEGALKRLGLLHYFSFVLSCSELNCTKSSATIYDEAINRLQLSKEEVVVFEDALYCIQTAKKAGYTVIGVYDKAADLSKETEEIKRLCDDYILDYTSWIKERNHETNFDDCRL